MTRSPALITNLNTPNNILMLDYLGFGYEGEGGEDDVIGRPALYPTRSSYVRRGERELPPLSSK